MRPQVQADALRLRFFGGLKFQEIAAAMDCSLTTAKTRVKQGLLQMSEWLKEGGVDWALDQYNEKLITPEMKAKVDAAKADIISGKITVVDYMSNNTCK